MELPFVSVAHDLEDAGLLWQPEIGDEVLSRVEQDLISVLVDPRGMSPRQLRETYLWLPTVEQMLTQLEVRQAVLFHAGLELRQESLCYTAVVQSALGHIECKAPTLRSAVGIALRDLLRGDRSESFH